MTRHVLLDADGVLQYLPGGWHAAMRPYLGERAEAFLEETWQDEKPALRGETDYLVDLARALTDYGVETSVAELYPAVWHSIEVIPETIAFVRELKAAGYGVHLGTNQEQHRADFMRTTLGYDHVFDVSCYSCELGVAKPDPAYFTEAAARIGAEPAEIVFIDDTERNVLGAREAGLAAEHWVADLDAPDRGLPRLRELLAAHGVKVD